MKYYIQCMSSTKRYIYSDLENRAEPLVQHLIKIVLYQDRGNLIHWLDELGGFVHLVHKQKHNNKYPTKEFIYNALWEHEKSYIDITIDNIKYSIEYEPYNISDNQIIHYIESYLDWLSLELSRNGQVRSSDCRRVAETLLKEYEVI